MCTCLQQYSRAGQQQQTVCERDKRCHRENGRCHVPPYSIPEDGKLHEAGRARCREAADHVELQDLLLHQERASPEAAHHQVLAKKDMTALELSKTAGELEQTGECAMHNNVVDKGKKARQDKERTL